MDSNAHDIKPFTEKIYTVNIILVRSSLKISTIIWQASQLFLKYETRRMIRYHMSLFSLRDNQENPLVRSTSPYFILALFLASLGTSPSCRFVEEH